MKWMSKTVNKGQCKEGRMCWKVRSGWRENREKKSEDRVMRKAGGDTEKGFEQSMMK